MSRSVQLAVLVVPTLEGEDPKALAERVYQAWWIGRRQADQGPRTFRADRPAGRVALSGPLLGWRRPLGAVKAVRIERRIDVQVDRLRRRRKPMSYATQSDLPARILLELEGAGARAITNWFPGTLEFPSVDGAEERRAGAVAHLEATAGALAASLGVPLRPLREVPPPGTVPPPLDEGASERRPTEPPLA